MSKVGESLETESRLVVTSGWGSRDWGATANAYGVSFWGDESVLPLGSSDGCTTLQIY